MTRTNKPFIHRLERASSLVGHLVLQAQLLVSMLETLLTALDTLERISTDVQASNEGRARHLTIIEGSRM